MMRRIDLLPGRYAQRRRQRQTVGLVAVVGLVLLLLLIVYWLYLGSQISSANDDLAAAQAMNTRLQTEISGLQQYADLETHVQQKAADLQTVMANDVDWPSIMTEVGMVIPSSVQLTTITASAGAAEGATPTGTETAPVRVAKNAPVGRIDVQGQSLTMSDVAQLLVRLATVPGFQAIYLNDATSGQSTSTTSTSTTTPNLISFDSSVELTQESLSGRFQETSP